MIIVINSDITEADLLMNEDQLESLTPETLMRLNLLVGMAVDKAMDMYYEYNESIKLKI